MHVINITEPHHQRLSINYYKGESNKKKDNSSYHDRSVYEALSIPAREKNTGVKYLSDIAVVSLAPLLDLVISVHIRRECQYSAMKSAGLTCSGRADPPAVSAFAVSTASWYFSKSSLRKVEFGIEFVIIRLVVAPITLKETPKVKHKFAAF